MTHGFLRGAQRHAQTNSDAPLGAAERLQALLRRKCASLDHSTARLTLGPAIYDFLTGRIREDPSEGLSNYVRANNRAYDATQHLLNCIGRLRAEPLSTIQRFAELLVVDSKHVRMWTFARLAAEPRDDWRAN